jgi:hypothetical protein
LLYRYTQHPEAKSLGQDGEPCKSDTRSFLERSHIIAGRHRRIGKESDRRWEEGDDLESLLRVPLEYEQPGEQQDNAHFAHASERLIRKIKKIGIRELVRHGCSRRVLERICRREMIPGVTLTEYDRRVRDYKLKGKMKISRLALTDMHAETILFVFVVCGLQSRGAR